VTHLLTSFLIAVALGGCIETDFDAPEIINRWRVIAVVAEPPTVGIDRQMTLTPYVLDPDGNRVTPEDGFVFDWVACVRPERIGALSGDMYSDSVPSRACGPGIPSLALDVAPDGTATVDVSGEAVRSLLDPENLDRAAALLGVPVEILDRIFREVGVIIFVQLFVCSRSDGGRTCTGADELHHRAYKRVIVRNVDADGLATNPWEPRFGVRLRDAPLEDNQWITARTTDEPFVCVPESGEPIVLPADTEVILDPEDVPLEPGPDTWIESYTVVSLTGELFEQNETAYYTFYSTGGSFSEGVTRAPDDEEIWTTPEEPGTYPLWLVVRDGHGGMMPCQIDVTVM
jgi:hypothetical protein